MTRDVVLAGVGGHRALSLGSLLAAAARADDLQAILSEVHGMAQRGGSVLAHLRIADHTIHSPLVRTASAHLLVATEPLEALRARALLAPDGAVVTAVEPHRNIPHYPSDDAIDAALAELGDPILVETDTLARRAGVAEARYVVLAGAASSLLPMRLSCFEGAVEQAALADARHHHHPLGEQYLTAFRAGREHARCRLT